MTDLEEQLAHLRGRQIALELLMTTSIIDQCARTPSGNLSASVEATKHVMMRSLQNLEWEPSEYNDAVMGHAADALVEQFDRCAFRAKVIDGS